MIKEVFNDISKEIERYREESIKMLSNLIEIKALSPENGGKGELKKAKYIESLLDNFDEVERYDAEDKRAEGGVRPNIIAKIRGKRKRRLWIVSHMDVVPEGDVSLWDTSPFKAVYKNGKVFGRGAEDNGQAIVSSILAGRALMNLGIELEYTLSLAIVSDEETGSRYGIKYLLEQNIFRKNDLFLVPDAGFPKGDLIEIAEKGVLWLKIEVRGKQGHASRPDLSKNANRKAMELLVNLDKELHKRFNKKNDLFTPPYSTFEPTKREKNVDNINTIPGNDISYIDCRIIPEYRNQEVYEFIREFCESRKDGFDIKISIVQDESSPSTKIDSEIVQRLKRAIRITRGVDAGICGIGGNTCASFFRKAGFETAVWATIDGKAHEANEYAKIDNVIEDAKVLAVLPLEI